MIDKKTSGETGLSQILDRLGELKTSFAEIINDLEYDDAPEESVDMLTDALDALEDAYDIILDTIEDMEAGE